MNEEETEKQINDKTDLPKAIIVKNVPKELFDEPQLKENFANLFKQIDENVRIDYLKGFQRVRVVFTEPEHATAAKLLVEHHSFNGVKLKAFFAQVRVQTRRPKDAEKCVFGLFFKSLESILNIFFRISILRGRHSRMRRGI